MARGEILAELEGIKAQIRALKDPSDANRRTLNALGIKDRQVKEAQIQQERTALERATEGRQNTSRKHRASQRRKEEAKRETLYDTLDDE